MFLSKISRNGRQRLSPVSRHQVEVEWGNNFSDLILFYYTYLSLAVESVPNFSPDISKCVMLTVYDVNDSDWWRPLEGEDMQFVKDIETPCDAANVIFVSITSVQ